ncbi:hypothetical protein CSKR_201894 [Clonorchis sinensis]|uniref:Uncharacterized protein n=1 Tax=Clonorchis sinensis TaxID=79923 RepID=A0A8T1MX72_CLOSI|nr:hypothetical protein CSKR_201894 [Clonorchis sinensis]
MSKFSFSTITLIVTMALNGAPASGQPLWERQDFMGVAGLQEVPGFGDLPHPKPSGPGFSGAGLPAPGPYPPGPFPPLPGPFPTIRPGPPFPGPPTLPPAPRPGPPGPGPSPPGTSLSSSMLYQLICFAYYQLLALVKYLKLFFPEFP